MSELRKMVDMGQQKVFPIDREADVFVKMSDGIDVGAVMKAYKDNHAPDLTSQNAT